MPLIHTPILVLTAVLLHAGGAAAEGAMQEAMEDLRARLKKAEGQVAELEIEKTEITELYRSAEEREKVCLFV